MKRSDRRLAAALAAAALALGVVAPASGAHVELSSSSPAAGAVTGTGVRKVTVTFSGTIRSGTLKVFRISTGKKVSVGAGGRDPRSVRRLLTKLSTGLTAGKYRVRWTIVAADGHHQSGTYVFRMRRR